MPFPGYRKFSGHLFSVGPISTASSSLLGAFLVAITYEVDRQLRGHAGADCPPLCQRLRGHSEEAPVCATKPSRYLILTFEFVLSA